MTASYIACRMTSAEPKLHSVTPLRQRSSTWTKTTRQLPLHVEADRSTRVVLYPDLDFPPGLPSSAVRVRRDDGVAECVFVSVRHAKDYTRSAVVRVGMTADVGVGSADGGSIAEPRGQLEFF